MAKVNRDMIGQIIAAIGGEGNVALCTNCMTRLRLGLNNEALADKEKIKKIPGVLGIVESDSQLQIVLGPGKAQTAAELMNNMLSEGSNIAASMTTPEGVEFDADLGSIAEIKRKVSRLSKPTLSISSCLNLQRFLLLLSRVLSLRAYY